MPSTLVTPVAPTGHLRASVLEDGRLTALIDTLSRDGIHVSVTREMHEWDAATATVTSHLTCIVDGRHAEGIGVARDRVTASLLAIRAAVSLRAG
jgi:hypothetical protein